jgi:hypothetical protein
VRWFETVVSGLPLCPLFKGQAVQEEIPLEMGQIGCPETSVSNRLSPRNNPEDGRIYTAQSLNATTLGEVQFGCRRLQQMNCVEICDLYDI